MIPHWWFDLVTHSAWYLFVFVFHLKKNKKKHEPQLNPYHPEWSCKVTFLTFLPSSTSILLAYVPQIGEKSKIHDQISQWWHSNNNRTDQKLAKIIASLAIISADFIQDNFELAEFTTCFFIVLLSYPFPLTQHWVTWIFQVHETIA